MYGAIRDVIEGVSALLEGPPPALQGCAVDEIRKLLQVHGESLLGSRITGKEAAGKDNTEDKPQAVLLSHQRAPFAYSSQPIVQWIACENRGVEETS